MKLLRTLIAALTLIGLQASIADAQSRFIARSFYGGAQPTRGITHLRTTIMAGVPAGTFVGKVTSTIVTGCVWSIDDSHFAIDSAGVITTTSTATAPDTVPGGIPNSRLDTAGAHVYMPTVTCTGAANGVPAVVSRPVTITARAPIGSCSVRAGVRQRYGGVLNVGLANETSYYLDRSRDFTNVSCADPFFAFWHGGVQQNGSAELDGIQMGTQPATLRMAIGTGMTGTALAAGGTVTPLTFNNMLNDPAFVAAGGTVTDSGRLITIPFGYIVYSDRVVGLTLTAGQAYNELVQYNRPGGTRNYNDGKSLAIFGDAVAQLAQNSVSAAKDTMVYASTWASPAQIPGSAPSMHHALLALGTVSAGTRTVAVVGDSIFTEDNQNGDNVDAFGVRGPVKRAINARGYSFVDATISGSNAYANLSTAGSFRARNEVLKWAAGGAVMSDMLHNDRVIDGWGGGLTSSFDNRYLNWMAYLRSAAPGAKIVQATLLPRTQSTDNWATLAGQTWAANNGTDYPDGDQWRLRERLLGVGRYQGVALTAADADAVYDFEGILRTVVAPAAGATSIEMGKWPVSGMPLLLNKDGTHPSTLANTLFEADLNPRLPALLGF